MSADSEDEKFEWLDHLSTASHEQAILQDIEPYYNTLGCKVGDPHKVVKRAYRKLALRNHPDKGGDKLVFQAVTEAYEVLCTLSEEEEKKKEDAEKFKVTFLDCEVQKGPPGVGLGLHIGSKFIGQANEEVCMVLGLQGLAEAKGELQEGDIIRKVAGHNLLTLNFDDIVALLAEVQVGEAVILHVERKVRRGTVPIPEEARNRSSTLAQHNTPMDFMPAPTPSASEGSDGSLAVPPPP